MPSYLMDFLNYLGTIQGKSINTMLVYFYDLRLFLRFLMVHFGLAPKNVDFDKIEIRHAGIEILQRVTLSDLYAYMSFVSSNRDNASHARARKVASIRSFFNYLTSKARLLSSNPAAELESPKILKKLPRYLSVEESRQLLFSIDGEHRERDYAIMTLFLNCGLRLSELVGINMANIRNETLTVIGKGGKERAIPLNTACMEALQTYLDNRSRQAVSARDRDALFLSERKKRISKENVQHIVKKFIRNAGLDPHRYSTHKLRHTAATLMYKYGHVDIRALQALLGHESIATTEIYTHLDRQQLKDAVESNPLAKLRPDAGK